MIDYPQLKDDDKLFASWDRVLQAIATAQDVHEVLDHTYIPTTLQQQEEQEQLFKAKNAFMYSVFVSTLNTAKSRKHVRKYQKDMDAQSLYASLKDAYETGTAADIAIEVIKSELMSELMSMKLDDRWKQLYEAFLDAWDHKVLDLENMLDENIYQDQKSAVGSHLL